jgi:hypothetical protein
MIRMRQPIGQAAVDAFMAQPEMQPGTWGFWMVWAARPSHMQPGDLLISKVRDTDETEVDYIVETFTAKSACRQGFVNHRGERLTVGIISPVVIARWGTHGTLAK